MKYLVPLLFLGLLMGCQQQPIRSSSPAVADTVIVAEDLQSLIDFSMRFQSYELAGQHVLCAELRQSYEQSGNRWTGWYLATAITQVDGCGEPKEAIDWIKNMLEQHFVSNEVSWLAHYQIRLLQYQQHQQQQLIEAATSQKKLQRRLTQMEKINTILESQLQDLKRIETSINRRLDEKQETH
ncbi:hypothetical protein [Sedimenticola selenatireducens]|jgi:hypothetical protein|uniref:Uncharacterized protein n=1 Tax=Sedimenticola selenatireducens TaxID=191960 RepID=A0A558DNR6_9GAMM|nr:hypothetical protein [Sedimenticola selenatireducens]TVO78491.1 hypothetical protein FHP88_02170 [Sedimenticola selenatireducens]TVT62650.1 MAG: hypothetical protein FHK78_13285 [Sedimenticola selenatireducens]